MKNELSSSAKKVLNDPELIAICDDWFKRLNLLFGGKDDSKTVFAIAGIDCYMVDKTFMYSEPERYVIQCSEYLAENAGKAGNTDVFVPLCIHNDLFGVHFIDSIFGCNVYYEHGQWYNDPLQIKIGTLKPPDIDNSEAWQLTVRMIDAFLSADVKLPIYGLPTIASALVVAVNLFGENILAAMLDEAEAAKHDLKIINDTLKELHIRLMNLIPQNQLQPVIPSQRIQPPGFGQLCGCTSQLISPECYIEMIMPLDDELLGIYPHGGMMHLCGKHDHHIPAFKTMPNLRSVQLNDRAAESLKNYYEGLRPDQIIYLNTDKNITPQKALEITNGKRLVLIGDHMVMKM